MGGVVVNGGKYNALVLDLAVSRLVPAVLIGIGVEGNLIYRFSACGTQCLWVTDCCSRTSG